MRRIKKIEKLTATHRVERARDYVPRRDAELSFNQNFTVSRRDITAAVKPPSYKRKCELSLSMRPRAYATGNGGARLDKLAALNLTSFIPAAAMSMQVRACLTHV